MRIAIIGAGISGLTAAHYLHADHEITIFEAGSHIGGHANTLVVEEDDRSLPIDTGFIVFNDWTCPHFQEMVLPLGVDCLLYTSPSPRDLSTSRMPSSA